MKTSKEKAIEALQKIESYHAYDNQFDDELKLVFAELSKPTIDDAIKVVELMKSKNYLNKRVLVLVLEALKGLKGE